MSRANDFRFFAIDAGGPRPLPVPPGASAFEDLLADLEPGVYDVVRTFNKNQFLYLDQHLARTAQSMVLLDWDYNWDQQRLRQVLHDLTTAAPFAEMRVRWDVLAAPATAAGSHSREVVALQRFTPPPARLYSEGVTVGFAETLRRETPLAKTADFAAARRAYTIGTDDAYERLLLDENGRILECTGANFYAVRAGVIYTAGEGVLAGVTRRILLTQAEALAIPVRLEAFPLGEIDSLDEAALSSSSRGLIPIVRIGRQWVGDGRPGPICQQLGAAYNRFVRSAVKTAVAA